MSSHASAHAAGQIGQRGRTARAVARTALVGLVAGGATMATVQIAQAVPTAPNNITVFPQRDFLSLEGYQNLVGQQATIVVTRAGVESSRAVGRIGAGDPALEVNHPGGVCWKGVTPNIKPGDTVTVSIPRPTGGTLVDSVRTLSPEVTEFRPEGAADLVISGTRAADVPTSQIEQRIVAPDLKETAVGRRDVRAPARSGPYTSTLRFPTATTFEATYHFVNDPSTPLVDEGAEMRDIAAAGQARALSWQAVDANDNRQGMTISEFGEVGGPGLGGCPAGPENMAPNAPAGVTAAAGDGWVSASWSPATAFPDGAAIDGYQVMAVNVLTGVRSSVIAPVCSTTCTATVPVVNGQAYRVQVQTLSAGGASAWTAATGDVTPVGGVVQPPGVVAPTAPGIPSAFNGTAGGAVTARVSWTPPAQPAGVTVDGWRISAFNATTGVRIKRMFVDAPITNQSVSFANAASVFFKVQAISADDAGTLSALSPASNTVLAR